MITFMVVVIVLRRLQAIIKWPLSAEERLEYISGLVYGDGCLERFRVEIYDGSLEFLNAVIEEVVKELTSYGVKSYWVEERKKYHCFRLRIYGKYFTEVVRDSIPELRERVTIPFTQGLFDAEGSIWRNPNIVAEVTVGDSQVLQGIKAFLQAYGINSKMRKDRTTYKLRITSMSKFLHLVGLRHPKHISRINLRPHPPKPAH